MRTSIKILMVCTLFCLCSTPTYSQCEYGDASNKFWNVMKDKYGGFRYYRWEVFPIGSVWGIGSIYYDPTVSDDLLRKYPKLSKSARGKLLSTLRCDYLLGDPARQQVANYFTFGRTTRPTESELYDLIASKSIRTEDIPLNKLVDTRVKQVLVKFSVPTILNLIGIKTKEPIDPAGNLASPTPTPTPKPAAATSTPAASASPSPTPKPAPSATPTPTPVPSATPRDLCPDLNNGQGNIAIPDNSITGRGYKCVAFSISNATFEIRQINKPEFLEGIDRLQAAYDKDPKSLNTQMRTILALIRDNNLYVVTDEVLVSGMTLSFDSKTDASIGAALSKAIAGDGIAISQQRNGTYSITVEKKFIFARKGYNLNDKDYWGPRPL